LYLNFKLFIKSDLQIERVEIRSLTGALLMFENDFTGKISELGLPAGVYLLQIQTDKGLVGSRFVKELIISNKRDCSGKSSLFRRFRL
jgi:hypothetical protein